MFLRSRQKFGLVILEKLDGVLALNVLLQSSTYGSNVGFEWIVRAGIIEFLLNNSKNWKTVSQTEARAYMNEGPPLDNVTLGFHCT